MATKKRRKSRKKSTPSTAAKATTAKAKFAGHVALHPPEDDSAGPLANGSHVVVSIRELSVGRLPESGARAELQFDATVRTTTESGKAVSAIWSPGIFYYVEHDTRLNVDETVIFDGPIHQHLSLDLQLVEREMPQMKPGDAAALAEAAAAAAADLVGASGPVGTALGAFPGVLGGILRLNGDDQVLKYSTSLCTSNVGQPDDSKHRLVEGVYRIEKLRRRGEPGAWVTLLIEIRVVK